MTEHQYTMTHDLTVFYSVKTMMVTRNENVTYLGPLVSGSKNELFGEVLRSSLFISVGNSGRSSPSPSNLPTDSVLTAANSECKASDWDELRSCSHLKVDKINP